jgi:hypothetical protein
MDRRAVMAGITLVAALMSVGCASGTSASGKKKVGVSGSRMCQAHGGTYNAATKSCTYTASTKSMREACAAQGGAFDDAADFCDMDPM